MLDFSDKITNANSYSLILREVLESFSFDYDDIDEMEFIEIEEINQWLNKAQDYIECDIPSEAILICKACIEEYASWYCEQDRDIIENVSMDYEWAFDILAQSVSMQGTDRKELLDYCKAEILKPKYKNAGMREGFSGLVEKLSGGASGFCLSG